MNKIIFVIICLVILFLIRFQIMSDLVLYDDQNHSVEKKDNCILDLELNCKLHYGDNIFNMFYLNKIKDYLEKNNIKIKYYLKENYIDQIKDFISTPNIILLPYQDKGLKMSLLNLTYEENLKNLIKEPIKKLDKIVYDKTYLDFYNETTKNLGLNIKIDDFLNTDPSLLTDYNMLPKKYRDIDVFIINSIPMSYQYLSYDPKKWEEFVKNLYNLGLKILTTVKIDNLPCTSDDNLSLKQIGAISTHSKIIIGINTGPMATIFNIYTLKFVDKIYLFDNRVTFSYDKIVDCDDLEDIDIKNILDSVNKFRA